MQHRRVVAYGRLCFSDKKQGEEVSPQRHGGTQRGGRGGWFGGFFMVEGDGHGMHSILYPLTDDD